jgi:transglutaminase-like putative cysteine protease
MRIDVDHLTTYSYSEPVALGPHRVRLRPRPDGSFRELDYALAVDPAPVLRREQLDAAGNLVTGLWFEGETRHLRIHSRFSVEAQEREPLGPPLEPTQRTLPVVYPDEEAACLAPFRATGVVEDSVRALANRLADETDGDPVAFLSRLTERLHREIQREIRPRGAPQTPAETLERGRGACRDQTVLFIATCRSMGLAARFVSGYQDRSALDTPERYLHAWPEAYVPRQGWQGFDPTRGIVVTNGHVPVAAAPEPSLAMPVDGSYFGAARSELRFEVRIRAGF